MGFLSMTLLHTRANKAFFSDEMPVDFSEFCYFHYDKTFSLFIKMWNENSVDNLAVFTRPKKKVAIVQLAILVFKLD